MTSDYSNFADKVPDASAIINVGECARDLYRAEQEVHHAEVLLRAAQAKVRDLAERTLPDLMEEAGLAEVKLANGGTLRVERKLTCSPLKANRPRVLAWLEDTGNGGKVKHAITVSVGKDADKERELTQRLTAEGFEDIEVRAWVEPATLRAHVNKCLKAGDEVDMDLLGARQYSKAKITGAPAPVFEGE